MKIITSMLQKIHSSQIIHGSISSNKTLETIINTLLDIKNNLTSTDINKSLSAYQGKVLNDRLVQTETDSGWITLNNRIQYRKVGKVVTVKGLSAGAIIVGNNVYTVVGQMPEGYRPAMDMMFEWSGYGGNYTSKSAWAWANGNIGLYLPTGQQTGYWGFVLTYLV